MFEATQQKLRRSVDGAAANKTDEYGSAGESDEDDRGSEQESERAKELRLAAAPIVDALQAVASERSAEISNVCRCAAVGLICSSSAPLV